MITLGRIRKIHEKVINFDKDVNPEDYLEGERQISILEIMLEYSIKDTNTVFKNAAIAMYTIVANHPFYNGNKRTGYETARMMLAEEGYTLRALKKDKVEFTVSIAIPEKKMKVPQIAKWLKKHAKKKTRKEICSTKRSKKRR